MAQRRRLLTRGMVVLTATVLVAAAMVASPATAAKVFTRKAALKLFYTKAQAHALFLEQAEADQQFLTSSEGDQQFLTPAEGDAQFLTPAEGNAAFLGRDERPDLPQYCRDLPASASYGPCAGSTSLVSNVTTMIGWPSVAVDAAGNPVMSWTGTSTANLFVTKCDDTGCMAGGETSDSQALNSAYSSIAIGPTGLPVVSYRDEGNDDLRLIICNDPACVGDNETDTLVSSLGDVGYETSLAMQPNGLPIISFLEDGSPDRLWLARCSTLACGVGNVGFSIVDATSVAPGVETSLAIGADGFPMIAYGSATAQLRFAKCNDAPCLGGDESIVTLDPAVNVSFGLSLAVGLDGNPVIAYNDQGTGDLKVVKCNDPACVGGGETFTTLDPSIAEEPSVVLGFDGNPIISYVVAGDLVVAMCNDPACAGLDETVTVADTVGGTGETAIEVSPLGYPMIASTDATNTDLRFALPRL